MGEDALFDRRGEWRRESKEKFVLERYVEQGEEVFNRRRRRVPDVGNEETYFEQQVLLPLAQLSHVGLLGLGCVDGNGKLVIRVFELSPSLMKRGGWGLGSFTHNSSPLADRADA